jgi:hypothetical protein
MGKTYRQGGRDESRYAVDWATYMAHVLQMDETTKKNAQAGHLYSAMGQRML